MYKRQGQQVLTLLGSEQTTSLLVVLIFTLQSKAVQYDSTKSYHGLDKLSLNNIIQDSTYMKDYLTYQMMGEFGVDAPLCSYVYITVNGEDWGLYLAVEGVEDAFLQRNYGSDYGELYKPDSMSFGGGRGNGRDFSMEDFMSSSEDTDTTQTEEDTSSEENASTEQTVDSSAVQGKMSEDFDPSAMQGEMPEGFDPSAMQGEMPENFDPSAMTGEMPEDFDASAMEGMMPGGFDPFSSAEENGAEAADGTVESFDPSSIGGGMNMGGGMGSDDVKLQYIDDDPDSYSNIFNNAKTDITEADQTRLIASLKTLSSGSAIESVVDVEEVLRYFVVHNFVCNGDSYTGSMIHNYYLYEKDGQLSMIPWDYNLAFGIFQSSDATDTVNSPIDSPVSGGSTEDRPMVDWIFSDETYTELYHQYFAEFLESVNMEEIIDSAAELIAPYVEKDPTKFYTYEEFETGVSTLREFCTLRTESVQGQLDGTIPSTSEGQSADSSALIDASHITISDMGSMNMGGTMGGAMGGDFKDKMQGSFPGASGGETETQPEADTADTQTPTDTAATESTGITVMQLSAVQPQQGDVQMPGGDSGTMPQMPGNGNMQAPNQGQALSSEAGTDASIPEGGTMQQPSGDMQMQMPDGSEMQLPQTQTEGATVEMPADMAAGGSAGAGTQGSEDWILLGISAGVLLIGLLITFKFKR